jgi:hypothetical protein
MQKRIFFCFLLFFIGITHVLRGLQRWDLMPSTPGFDDRRCPKTGLPLRRFDYSSYEGSVEMLEKN